MEKYLVGGAVRDSLLKLPIKEKDWVITGSSPQEMLKIGYQQVGKDFPVFLHPKNHEEYALARTERKSGQGYTGFTCYTAPSITIEEDLYRRDLTINAMAYDMHGNLLDPYNGQKDIELRLLRHVSDAFYEDPLRVLRVARFAARFKHIGFSIAQETLKLMTSMTHELKSLSSERIWIETKKALLTDNPQIYFQVLHKCGALKILFPELNILFSIPGLKKWHANTDNLGHHTMIQLSNFSRLHSNLSLRFAILCCNLGEITYLSKNNTNQYSIQQSKTFFVKSLCRKLKLPRNIYKLSKIVAIYYNYLHNITILSPEMIIILFDAFGCWSQPDQIEEIILINKSNNISHGKYDNNNYLYIQERFLRTAFILTTYVKTSDVIKDGFTGSNISRELYSRRLDILRTWNTKEFIMHKN